MKPGDSRDERDPAPTSAASLPHTPPNNPQNNNDTDSQKIPVTGDAAERAHEHEHHEESSYLRTAFLERVAHELRGPAGVIQGALQELEAALGEDVERHQAMLAMARRGVRRIVRTADRLQQTGVLERGPMQLTRVSCDLAALLRTAATEAATVEGRKNIRLEIEVPETPCSYDVDARWMTIALYELASNAIRHARSSVQVTLRDSSDGFQLSFIDDNQSSRPFGPVRFRAPSEGRGLGLALAIVRDVIAAHGGNLEIDATESSQAARGARVHVHLPLTVSSQGRVAAL